MTELEIINQKMKKEYDDAVKKCMESTDPLRTAFSEVLRQWDGLGEYKDDDFGNVSLTIEVARDVMMLTEKVKND